MPAFTFVASASACALRRRASRCFATFAARHDFNIDPEDVARRITPRTRAVIAVHFCGYPGRCARAARALRRARAVLIEDCAQAIGAHVDAAGRQVGTVGELGCFSFFSKKQLCVGEGGMVSTADEELDASVRLFRSHAMTSSTWDRHRGHDPAYDVVDIGFNFRLDEPRAALGLSRLQRLDEDIAARRATRSRLPRAPGRGRRESSLPSTSRPSSAPPTSPSRCCCADRDTRDRFRDELKANGIQTTWYPALHTFTEYRALRPPDGLPGATEVADRHCALPLSSTMTRATSTPSWMSCDSLVAQLALAQATARLTQAP